ncbi:hypothetical protein EG68_12015 [Paragonimus skrjabini miyazakii]|uniref:Uncharacterized protein n=1 Tax=Paragonimus skrjabini miyazakii TaxID=59628 RepID=A0A8S9YVX7_9TREM|nr:hypothetical protein EG68_12015 [Paragonimus skrjabini miyazakii]
MMLDRSLENSLQLAAIRNVLTHLVNKRIF